MGFSQLKEAFRSHKRIKPYGRRRREELHPRHNAINEILSEPHDPYIDIEALLLLIVKYADRALGSMLRSQVSCTLECRRTILSYRFLQGTVLQVHQHLHSFVRNIQDATKKRHSQLITSISLQSATPFLPSYVLIPVTTSAATCNQNLKSLHNATTISVSSPLPPKK